MGKKELMSILIVFLDPSKAAMLKIKLKFAKKKLKNFKIKKKPKPKISSSPNNPSSLSEAQKVLCSDYNLNICFKYLNITQKTLGDLKGWYKGCVLLITHGCLCSPGVSGRRCILIYFRGVLFLC